MTIRIATIPLLVFLVLRRRYWPAPAKRSEERHAVRGRRPNIPTHPSVPGLFISRVRAYLASRSPSQPDLPLF